MTERRLRGAWIEAVFGPVPSTLPEGVRMTKSRAWEMCCAAGLRAGIPQHAWVKYHSPHGWMWRTVPYEKIVQREKAMTFKSHAQRRNLYDEWLMKQVGGE